MLRQAVSLSYKLDNFGFCLTIYPWRLVGAKHILLRGRDIVSKIERSHQALFSEIIFNFNGQKMSTGDQTNVRKHAPIARATSQALNGFFQNRTNRKRRI